MKLVTNKQALVECLGIVNKAVSSRSSIQVLSGVLIDARSEGIVLSATDMEISIKAPLAGRVEQPGSLVVPARIASEIARSLPAGEVVHRAAGRRDAGGDPGGRIAVQSALAARRRFSATARSCR